MREIQVTLNPLPPPCRSCASKKRGATNVVWRGRSCIAYVGEHGGMEGKPLPPSRSLTQPHLRLERNYPAWCSKKQTLFFNPSKLIWELLRLNTLLALVSLLFALITNIILVSMRVFAVNPSVLRHPPETSQPLPELCWDMVKSELHQDAKERGFLYSAGSDGAAGVDGPISKSLDSGLFMVSNRKPMLEG